MTLRSILAALLLFLPLLATVHNFVDGQRVTSTGVVDRGELILDRNKLSCENRNSSQLAERVRVIQHIAGRSSAKEKNANLIRATKAVGPSHDRYQTTTVINADDAVSGTGMFAYNSIESNKKLLPWSQFIVNSNGLVHKVWQLDEKSSVIVVLDKDGCVKWAKDGTLTQQEVQQIIDLSHKLLDKWKPRSRG